MLFSFFLILLSFNSFRVPLFAVRTDKNNMGKRIRNANANESEQNSSKSMKSSSENGNVTGIIGQNTSVKFIVDVRNETFFTCNSFIFSIIYFTFTS